MEPEPKGVNILPCRSRMVAKLQPQRGKLLLTNLYPLNVNMRMSTYYQYTLETENNIPADSKDVIARIIRSVKR